MKLTITVRDIQRAKLKNQLYGLLCEYEKERDWEAFLDSILIELMGYPEEEKTASYYTLFHKITSLRYLSYKYFRTTIFDCMNLISKETNNEQVL
jgi:uncharacterized protein YgfB (UPF0149 family)